jgi:DNA-binding GntR family transcriptional regulator
MEILSVTESIVQYLRNQIISGQLSPGQKLDQNEMTMRLNVSGPPLREAFRILEHEHLVINIPRNGFFVTDVSLEFCKEIYDARCMIESFSIDLLKENNIRSLPKVVSVLYAASNLSSPPAENSEQMLIYWKTFADYHVNLVESCGNRQLDYFYRSISSNLARYQFMYLRVPGAYEDSIKDHQHILELLETGRYHNAKECLKLHISHAFELLKSTMNPREDQHNT